MAVLWVGRRAVELAGLKADPRAEMRAAHLAEHSVDLRVEMRAGK